MNTLLKPIAAFAALTLLPAANLFAQEYEDYELSDASESPWKASRNSAYDEQISGDSSATNFSFALKGFYALALEDNPTKIGSADRFDLGGISSDFIWALPVESDVVVPEFCLSAGVGYGESDFSFYGYGGEFTYWSANFLAGVNIRLSGKAASFYIGPRFGVNYQHGKFEFLHEEGTDDDLGLMYGAEAGIILNFTPNSGLTFSVSYLASEAEVNEELVEKQSWATFSVGYRHTF